MTDAHVVVTMKPRHGFKVIPSGSPLSPIAWSNFIADTYSDREPTTLFDDGVAFEFNDRWLSWGVKQIDEAKISLPTFFLGRTLSLLSQMHEGVSVCPGRAGSQSVIRPRRFVCTTDREKPGLFQYLGVCRGQDHLVLVDTSPLPFLTQAEGWSIKALSWTSACYSSFGPDEEIVHGSEMPFEGVDLPYAIEDEMDGSDYPRPDALRINARVLDGREVRSVPGSCATWRGKLAKKCWRIYEALPTGACAIAWPVTIDRKAKVLHMDYTGQSGLSCHLLWAVEAPEGDSVHAMAFKLWSPSP